MNVKEGKFESIFQPELSTFALLDPEYKATSSRQVTINDNIEGTREKSPLKRCLSVDSLKPLPNLNDFQMSHQPSSLSLNDAENFKENENERRVSKSVMFTIFRIFQIVFFFFSDCIVNRNQRTARQLGDRSL